MFSSSFYSGIWVVLLNNVFQYSGEMFISRYLTSLSISSSHLFLLVYLNINILFYSAQPHSSLTPPLFYSAQPHSSLTPPLYLRKTIPPSYILFGKHKYRLQRRPCGKLSILSYFYGFLQEHMC